MAKIILNKKYNIAILIFLCCLISFFTAFFSVSFYKNKSSEQNNFWNLSTEILQDEENNLFKEIAANSISYSEVYNYSASAPQDSYFCLRDEHLLLTEDQQNMGLCWVFATVKSLQSFFAMKTGEYYDFSEAWVALCYKAQTTSYVFGEGANTTASYYRLFNDGFLFENEFPYTMVYNIDNSNYQEIYNNYLPLSQRNSLSFLKTVSFLNEQTKISDIKQYIINNGALPISYDASSTVTNQNGLKCAYRKETDNSDYSGHAISVIGWDDTVSFTDKYGTAHTGAFMCLNSWGANHEYEIVYIPYNYTGAVNSLFGYGLKSSYYTGERFDLQPSNNNLENKLVNINNYSGLNTSSSTSFKEGNIFTFGEIPTLTYSLYNYSNANEYSISITKNGKPQNEDFTTNFNLNTYLLSITANKAIDSGTYNISITEDTNNDNIIEYYYNKQLFVYSGSDFCTIYNSSQNRQLNIWEYENYLFSSEFPNEIDVFIDEQYTCLRLAPCTISNLISFNVNSFDVGVDNSFFIQATSDSYAKGYVYFTFQNMLSNDPGDYERIVTCTTIDGNEISLKLIIHNLASEDNVACVFFDTDNYLDTGYKYKYYALGDMNSVYNKIILNDVETLPSGKHFSGWYLDKNYNTSLLSNDIYSLTQNNIDTADCTNSYDLIAKINQISYVRYYAFVYAKIESGTFTVDSIGTINTQYGDLLSVQTGEAKYGSGNYQYSVNTSTLPDGVTFNATTHTLEGNIEEIGNFTVIITVTDLTLSSTVESTVDIISTQRLIEITIDNVSAEYGTLQNLSYTISSGTIYNDDELNIQLSCFASQNITSVGNYTINGTFNNSNYSVTFHTAKYTVFAKTISARWSNTLFTYDTNFHCPTVSLNGIINNEMFEVVVSGQQANAGKNYVANLIINTTNYVVSNPTCSFEIQKAVLDINSQLQSITFSDNELKDAKTLQELNLPEFFHWVSPEQEIEYGENIYQAYYAPADTDNYEQISNINITLIKNYDYTILIIIVSSVLVGIIFLTIIIIVLKNKKTKHAPKNIIKKPVKTENKNKKLDIVKITFVTNSNQIIEPLISEKSIVIDLPKLQRNYFEFCGWYTDKICLNPYVNNGLNDNLTLYAKWRVKPVK